MKKLFQIGLLLWLAANATAQESPAQNPPKVLRTYDWKDLPLSSTNCQIVSMDGVSVLKIENTNGQPLELTLLQITNPSVIKKTSFLSCDMKYEDVGFRLVEHTNNPFPDPFKAVESASLKLLEQLPPSADGGDDLTNESSFAFGGPARLQPNNDGTSNWKPFRFDVVHVSIERGVDGSFDSVPERLPKELKMTLFLPTNGTVYLRPIKLLGVTGSWWSEKEAPWIGAIGGPIVGCLGGLLGWLSGKGKARKLVLAIWKSCIAVGILFLIALFIALATGQPEYVSMPLFVFGIVTTTVFGTILPTAKKRYDELEIRRMASIDAMES